MQLTVRALMVKTLDIRSSAKASGLSDDAGPMSYQDAIHLLLETPLPRPIDDGFRR